MSFAAPRHIATGPDTLTADDFETSSIISAAPSYNSEAPSYHSTVPSTETAPPYAPRSTDDLPQSSPEPPPQNEEEIRPPENSPEPREASQRRRQPTGLPPVPDRPLPMPSLSAFAIPTWSTFAANPATRHYHSVAQRRVAAANERVGNLRRGMLEQVLEEEDERARELRPLEDPYLVGEEAARKARAARLACQLRGTDVLVSENRRWDWYLAQTRDLRERERSWKTFRRRMEDDERKSFVRRITGRFAS